MTPIQIQLVQSSFAKVLPIAEPAAAIFYARLFELALAADRSYILAAPGDAGAPRITLSDLNMATYATVANVSRLHSRFYGESASIEAARAVIGQVLEASAAAG